MCGQPARWVGPTPSLVPGICSRQMEGALWRKPSAAMSVDVTANPLQALPEVSLALGVGQSQEPCPGGPEGGPGKDSHAGLFEKALCERPFVEAGALYV